MKRFLLTILAALLLVPGVWADSDLQGKVNVFEIENSSATASASTAISTDYIGPGARIIGIGVSRHTYTRTSENWVSITDTVYDKGTSYNEVIAEAEYYDKIAGTDWFPYPKTVTTQLTLGQGINTRARVFYIR